MSDLTILIPTKNEVNSVGLVIDAIRSLPLDCKILVVDAESRDGTLNVLYEKGVDVLIEPRRGKGVAVRVGIQECKTPYLIMLDGDFTYPPEYLLVLYYLLWTRADMVVGFRISEPGAMSALHRLGNFGLNLIASELLHYKVRDLCSGMRGFRMEAVRSLDLQSNGFEIETETWVKAIRKGLRIEQVPIAYRPRVKGDRSKLRFVDGFHFLKYIWSNRK